MRREIGNGLALRRLCCCNIVGVDVCFGLPARFFCGVRRFYAEQVNADVVAVAHAWGRAEIDGWLQGQQSGWW